MASQGIGERCCPVALDRPRGARPGPRLTASVRGAVRELPAVPAAPPAVERKPAARRRRAPSAFVPAAPGHKVCKACLAELPIADFGRNSKLLDGLQSKCRACVNAYNKARKAARRRAA